MNARAWLCGALFTGLGVLALSWPAQSAGRSTAAPDTMPAAPATGPSAVSHSVVSSGMVQAIRELPAEVGSAARQFEMTIRMRDGTMRVSHETGAARWRAGDEVRLIGSQAGT